MDFLLRADRISKQILHMKSGNSYLLYGIDLIEDPRTLP